jgi:hypothetical protein
LSASLVKPDEEHFTVQQIAEMWVFHPSTVIDLFREEEGVIRLGNPVSTAQKRAFTTLRIPRSVMERVHRRLQVKKTD